MGVHSLTFSYIPKSMKCDSRVSLLVCTFASLCLAREPKAKVTTFFVYLVPNLTNLYVSIDFNGN